MTSFWAIENFSGCALPNINQMFGTLPILENNAKVAFKFEILVTTIGNATLNILNNRIFFMCKPPNLLMDQ